MTEPARKKAHIVTDFSDAGTGEQFTANSTPMLDAGAYANYEAAGLVRAPAVTPKATPKRTTAAKRTSAAPKSVAPGAPASPPARAPAPEPIAPSA